MKAHQYIGGLMAEMTNIIEPGCFSLIPFSTIEHQYIRKSRYILQKDLNGKVVGYILHGVLRYGSPLYLTQVAIEYDLWERGHGIDAVNELFIRAENAGCSSIRLRCALDLPAISFWQRLGFKIVGIKQGGQKRKRMIAIMAVGLKLSLFDAKVEDSTS